MNKSSKTSLLGAETSHAQLFSHSGGYLRVCPLYKDQRGVHIVEEGKKACHVLGTFSFTLLYLSWVLYKLVLWLSDLSLYQAYVALSFLIHVICWHVWLTKGHVWCYHTYRLWTVDHVIRYHRTADMSYFIIGHVICHSCYVSTGRQPDLGGALSDCHLLSCAGFLQGVFSQCLIRDGTLQHVSSETAALQPVRSCKQNTQWWTRAREER